MEYVALIDVGRSVARAGATTLSQWSVCPATGMSASYQRHAPTAGQSWGPGYCTTTCLAYRIFMVKDSDRTRVRRSQSGRVAQITCQISGIIT